MDPSAEQNISQKESKGSVPEKEIYEVEVSNGVNNSIGNNTTHTTLKLHSSTTLNNILKGKARKIGIICMYFILLLILIVVIVVIIHKSISKYDVFQTFVVLPSFNIILNVTSI